MMLRSQIKRGNQISSRECGLVTSNEVFELVLT
jgi:hypothetical protein